VPDKAEVRRVKSVQARTLDEVGLVPQPRHAQFTQRYSDNRNGAVQDDLVHQIRHAVELEVHRLDAVVALAEQTRLVLVEHLRDLALWDGEHVHRAVLDVSLRNGDKTVELEHHVHDTVQALFKQSGSDATS